MVAMGLQISTLMWYLKMLSDLEALGRLKKQFGMLPLSFLFKRRFLSGNKYDLGYLEIILQARPQARLTKAMVFLTTPY